MRNIKILDCSLRDGGYLNDWYFGEKTIKGIGNYANLTGVDIFEICFMRKDPFDINRCCYSTMAEIDSVIPKKSGVLYAAMIEASYGFPVEEFPDHSDHTIDIIRIVTWSSTLDRTFDYCNILHQKGYQVFIQPTRLEQYSIQDFQKLVEYFNPVHPEAIYMVDTFGCINSSQLSEYAYAANKVMDTHIALGYHAHNNMQQAVENAKTFLSLDLSRDIILDASIMGMGRGAGNLPLEIIGTYLNKEFDKSFHLDAIYEVADKYVTDVYKKTPWGYSIYYYLTALYQANPVYVSYLTSKENFSYSDMNKILHQMTDKERVQYSAETAESLYRKICL